MEKSNLTMHIVPSRIINEARTNKAIISLHVSSEDDDGIYVATDTFSTVYGAGESTGQAIDDYVENLFEQLADLEHEEDHLGESLRSELAAIRRHLRRTA